MNLEFCSTEELLEEVHKRFDVTIFAAFKFLDDEKYATKYAYTGKILYQMSLQRMQGINLDNMYKKMTSDFKPGQEENLM